MIPSPASISLALDATPAPWWEVLGALGPLAILLGAIVAAVIGGFTFRQRALADDRSEWWRRAQWALDRALDDHPSTKALGLATLEVLAHSTLAHADELKLFDAAWASLNAPDDGERTMLGSKDMALPERRVQVAAARLRVTLDDRLGRVTPEEVKALAKEPF